MLGRAVLYGLAAAGEAGVTRVIEILGDELDRTLAMLGCRGVADLSAAHVEPSAAPGEGW
jgi:(S)-mandelate dehydrogenase